MENILDIMNKGATSATTQQLTPKPSASHEQSQDPAGAARSLASCDLCRRRKVRCDRGKPCSNCLRTGATCVSSTLPRVPRDGKVGRRKPDGEIFKRIAKLENLVKYLETENSAVLSAVSVANEGDARPTSEMSDRGEPNERQLKSSESATPPPKDILDRYLSSSFWVTLSEQVRPLPLLSPSLGSTKMCSLTLTPN
jgi:Fungal Zn(2)-Cys(6) binuclear cluster domain